jgi:hypothetical protein
MTTIGAKRTAKLLVTLGTQISPWPLGLLCPHFSPPPDCRETPNIDRWASFIAMAAEAVAGGKFSAEMPTSLVNSVAHTEPDQPSAAFEGRRFPSLDIVPESLPAL